MKDKESKYEEFIKHTKEWDEKGISYGVSELKELAKKYGLPIPQTK